MKKGSSLEVIVERLASSGDGVGRIDNKVVFIPNSCPGDRLLVAITEDKKSFSRAKILKILEKGPQRVEPPCVYYETCGGCSWQHVDYQEQLRWKQHNLLHSLKALGIDLSQIVRDIAPSPKQYGYRNRIQVDIGEQGPSFRQRGSHLSVAIEKCLLADELINQKLPGLRKPQGRFEVASIEGEARLFPVDTHGHSSLGFRQVNDGQNQRLIEETLALVNKIKPQKVVDLYCGQGNWIRAIAQNYPHCDCLGIDNNPTNIEKARTLSGERLSFQLGKVEDLYESQPGVPDLVIIDPPRAGCDPSLLGQLNGQPSSHLIYISCHPATLVRDLKVLLSGPWQLEQVLPVDMFPQTPHLETWCLLRSASSHRANQ